MLCKIETKLDQMYVSTAALLPTFLITKNSGLCISVHFHKNSLIVTCTFSRFEIRTLRPNGFKNQANDTLKLLDHNANNQQVFVKEKIFLSSFVVFELKFPKNFY